MEQKQKLIARLGLNKNVIREAKQVGGKFFCWVPRQGQWVRCRKDQVEVAPE